VTGPLHEEVRRQAAATPGRAAVLAPGRPPLTYGELWKRAEAIAAAVERSGITPDGVVAAVLPDDAELLCAFLGVSAVAAFAPLNPALRPSEFEFHLADMRAGALIADPASPAIAAANAHGIRVLRTTGVAAEVLSARAGGAGLCLHTSATTGRPKLVCLTQANLRAMADYSTRALALSGADRLLSIMPMFHLQGLLSALEQLMLGGSVVCPRAFDAGRFPAWMEEFDPTWYTAGPALHSAILKVEKNAGASRRRGLRFVRSIGAALPPGLAADLEQTLGIPVLEGYGLTEAGAVTSNPLPPGIRKPGSAGRSVGPEVTIIDNCGGPAPPGTAGEIVVRGPSVVSEYRYDPGATRAAFRDGWLRTGDLGRFDEQGYLFVIGRIKEMINRGGEKILPGEIDQALGGHPDVAAAAAFAIPHRSLGQEVAAAAVLRPGAAATSLDVRRFAAERLAPYKVPRRIVFVDSIPTSATGKPRRAALADDLGPVISARAPYRAPSTPTEETLAAIWTRILETGPVGLDDDFFDLGGDSLAVTLMLAEIRERFGKIADPSEFFFQPTIALLARLVDTRVSKGEASPVLLLQPHGSLTPLFCIPGAGDDPYGFRHLAGLLGRARPFYVLRDPERGACTVEDAADHLVDAVVEKQAHAPFLLAGHCYGGIVAFELARRLEQRGERVALVALFDSPTPGYPRPARHWKQYCRRALSFPFDAQTTLRDVASHAEWLLRVARRRLPRPRAPVDGAQAPSPAGAREAAARAYRPGPLLAKVAVFLADGEHHSTRIVEDSRLGWRDFARGGFEVFRVPGKHDSILSECHVGNLAAHLARVLAAAE
jgi:acyl-CoA synthetase (AMP-forming)/AMP-acid ligase II/thioesterase domain-containing protein